MSKLEDILGKKKTVVPVLDLSKSIIQSKEEFKRLMEKVPDYKMRPVKVRSEEIKIKEKDYSFKTPRKETRKLLKQNGIRDINYTYMDPIPNEMRSIHLVELCSVPIDWKMLTTLRPKAKIEEEYFSKLVEMGKLQLKTDLRDKREYTLNTGVRKVKNKSGIIETRVIVCTECSEEMCYGRTCGDFNYDLYSRVEVRPPNPKTLPKTNNNKNSVFSKKKALGSPKKKSKKRSQSRSPEKKGKDV
ncbi:uncharacterized protein LOC129614956 [Condylostylus longicornis]|uniref:uncharacterized protein LOC129614956 n=1 Tax=Condylostylus longicornis TaxID=2530218 RepID=UPI00244DD143|nr:uncharacterized protein LOC129614956 [Condylostylus longicornis]